MRRRLRIAVVVSVLVAVIGGVLGNWDHLFGIPPERVVNIYRVHGCQCAFAWKRALEAAGYTVRLREYETLEFVRQSARVPAHLHGCHVARYLGYFLEGHVPASALRRLATERPVALGLATQAATTMGEEHKQKVVDSDGQVRLVEPDGQLREWPQGTQ
ncbi:DUF411 domain-containing protein [Steroidobacter sp.]|uniref:DUF411 domain-containing protein n=1 Tax=Steroidobacter sp. TaxID=1978227 RepID=UPI0025E8A0BB|nr:DUF411 domain-containing protein [Steroidobacter sp.]